MSDKARITLDMKKNRIRIFKATLKSLNNPKYIQLLFNPEESVVAIRCIDMLCQGDCAERSDSSRVIPGMSFELYSISLIKQIQSVAKLESSCSYQLTGSIIPSERVAVFPMKTLQKNERTRGDSPHG